MSKFIFIIGGARSGKSRYGQDLAKSMGGKIAFVATCVPGDKEMKKRVALHKSSRPRHWTTIEEPKNLKSVLGALKNKFDVVIIDCLGILVSNLLASGSSEKQIQNEIASVANVLSKSGTSSIVVSNEVGGGIVPDNALARKFRDILGLANQVMADSADDVILMQSGIPVTIKRRFGSG
ncbi:MAG: bifunctional adenosylcobinamide kinase/adenosylcobinamide-phosphate guanylyltransferase [Candidatus Omnitrophica bacterium]|nr:bifunctional adenosylcobinamide kinase/adenosylcobinamide-phosphate guanylyltransferase [Candidatus Omnitrophota bacterium]